MSWLGRGKNGESERRTEVGGLWDEQGNPRRERTGRCLNIEHMSVSPLKPTRPTKIEATTVDHRTTILLSKTDRERERFSQTLPVLRPRVCCYAASCFHAFQSSVFLFLLLPPLLLLFIFLYLRSFFWVGFRTRMSNAGFLSIFRDKWIEICKGYIPVLRGNKVTGER